VSEYKTWVMYVWQNCSICGHVVDCHECLRSATKWVWQWDKAWVLLVKPNTLLPSIFYWLWTFRHTSKWQCQEFDVEKWLVYSSLSMLLSCRVFPHLWLNFRHSRSAIHIYITYWYLYEANCNMPWFIIDVWFKPRHCAESKNQPLMWMYRVYCVLGIFDLLHTG